MALHGKANGSDIHTAYRFIVADEAARLAITLNPDGSAITTEDGLYTKLYQEDTSVEYLCTAVSPLTFSEITAAADAHTHDISDVNGLQTALDSKLENETITSLSVNANVLTYTDEDGVDTDIDLSLYLDDTNLARIVSGTLDPVTGIMTVTRDDGTTFTMDMSALLDTQVTVTDDLLSTSATDALSANQGRELKDLIDAGTGSGEATFVASGTIPAAGVTVGLNVDGTVSVIENTAMPIGLERNTFMIQDEGNPQFTACCLDPVSGYVLVARETGQGGKMWVGTINQNDITFNITPYSIQPVGHAASHVEFIIVDTASIYNIIILSLSNLGITYQIAYIDNAAVMHFSSSTLVADINDNGSIYNLAPCYNAIKNELVLTFCCADSNNYRMWFTALDITNVTSPVIIGNTRITSNKIDTGCVCISYNPITDKYIVGYSLTSGVRSPNIIEVTVDVSITYTTSYPVTTIDYERYGFHILYSSTLQKTVILLGKSTYLNVVVLASDGAGNFSHITNSTVLPTGGAAGITTNKYYHDLLTDKLIVLSQVGVNYQQLSKITFINDSQIIGDAFTDINGTMYDAGYSLFSTNDPNILLAAYWDQGNTTNYPTYATLLRHTATVSTNADDFIGFAQTAVADTEDVDVILHGGIDELQSSLVPTSEYYVDGDGSLSDTDTGFPRAGIALSATSIAVLGDDKDTTYSVGDGGLTEINFTSADKANIDLVPGLAETNHKNGFNLQDLSTIGKPTWDDATRKMTMTPIVGQPDFHYWIDGFKQIHTVAIESDAIPDVTGKYYFYFDDNNEMQSILEANITLDVFYKYAICGLVYWNATAGIGKPFKEQHGYRIDSADHEMEHMTFGARYAPPGMGLMGLVDGQTTWTGIASGKFFDEDIRHIISAIPELPFMYRLGTGVGEWFWTAPDNNIAYMNGGSDAVWNKFDGTNYILEPADSSHDFILHFVVAHKLLDGYVDGSIIIDQNGYNNRGNARDAIEGAKEKLILDGLPSPELCFLGCYIARKDGKLEDLADGSTYYNLRGSSSRGGGGASSASSNLAADILVDTSGFDKNLSVLDNVLQIALQTINDMDLGSGGSTWTIASTTLTASTGNKIIADTSTAAFTITLPLSPSAGDSVKVGQGQGAFSINNLTMGRNSETIMGLSEDFIIDVDNMSPEFIYDGSDWRIA